MVRALKEENQDLKKMIENLNKKLTGVEVIGEEDRAAIKDLTEQYEANTKMAMEMGGDLSRKAI